MAVNRAETTMFPSATVGNIGLCQGRSEIPTAIVVLSSLIPILIFDELAVRKIVVIQTCDDCSSNAF